MVDIAIVWQVLFFWYVCIYVGIIFFADLHIYAMVFDSCELGHSWSLLLSLHLIKSKIDFILIMSECVRKDKYKLRERLAS